MAIDKQTKFTLSDDAKFYLMWLAQDVFFLRTDHEVARHLVTQKIEEMRRSHKGSEPSLAELRAEFSNSSGEESE